MADGSQTPGWVFRAFDYLGLGCILISPAEFIIRPKIWQVWSGILIGGCVFLWFGDKVPKLKIGLLNRWRASKALADALAENADLRKQLSAPRDLRLEIISASWGIEGIEVYDVRSELVEKQHGDSLAERVTVGLFHGRDPLQGNPSKVLKVRYSFDGREATIVRREWSWIIIPENKILEERLNALQRDLNQAKNVESVLIAVNGVPVAGPVAHAEERAQKEAAGKPLDSLFSPVQIDALTLARDLRDFYAGFEPFPDDPIQAPGEENVDYLARLYSTRSEKQGKWGMKLLHGYANRGFGKRITSLMNRAGEEFGYPAYVPSYAETIIPTKDAIPKLAQQMEMVAVWINRKQRNEVNLLG